VRKYPMEKIDCASGYFVIEANGGGVLAKSLM